MTASFETGRVPEWTIADRARKARETAGMNQTELANAMGVARSTVQRIEQGVAEPSRTRVIAWSFATGVALEWLEKGETPAGEGPDGGNAVRHQGIEPRTH
ncbi:MULTISPECIES: helix-turn-helix domain-containing protein [Corynebacterium]|uniref:Transcriptional regulator n=1 Tax=Corynebacterium hadale TaxID=2026255 RepID=A0A269PFW9_9CORY|nr:transcriptional regulator [Corynebacterium hadale]